jgi:hypothetical protein
MSWMTRPLLGRATTAASLLAAAGVTTDARSHGFGHPFVSTQVVGHACHMAETNFDEWIAQRYERLWPELFDPEVVGPTVDFLATLAGAGPALEFGIGTGRIALPLSRRGVGVHGIELSPAMAEQLQAKQEAAAIGVSIGDFATTRVDGEFSLVYLLRNTITNLTTQAEQVECFRNAAKHLEVGGFFVIENYVPNVRHLSSGELTYVFTSTPDHVGIEEYDLAAQIAVSRHWWVIDGGLKTFSSPHRYVWPSELDLMARFAGMVLVDRYATWHREPFTSDSRNHVSVWQKKAA